MDVYHNDLSKNLQRLRQDDKYTDVTITPFGNRERKFRCHRVILAALSSYFETMFDAGLSETITGEVEWPYDEELCETVLSFIYTGNDVSNMENVADLLEVANMMQIESLRLTCLNFLQSNLAKENCVSVMQTADLQDSKELFEKARSLVLKCFDFVAETDDFTLLDIQQLISILKADNLNCSNERIICEAALAWIDADYENRIDYICEILDALANFPVSSNVIEAKVEENHPRFKDYPQYQEKLNTIKQQKLCLAVMPMHDEAMVVVGGSEGGSNTKVMAFSFRQKKWFNLPELPQDPGYNFALCSNGIDMYISGGSGRENAMLKFDGQKNTWQSCPPVPNPRQFHCMVAVNNSVYLLGGCKTSNGTPIAQVDRFSLSLSNYGWTGQYIHLPTPVRSASVAVQGDNVYILGGMDESKKPVPLAQVMNAKEHYTFQVFYTLPEEVKLQSRAITLDNEIYLIGKSGEIIQFFEKEKAKQVGKVEHFPRKGFGVCVFENKILIVGGEVRLQAKKDMLQYNVKDNLTVLMQETLPVCLRDFCYTKLPVEQRRLVEEC